MLFGVLLVLLLHAGGAAQAQTGSATVDMSMLDGLAITPDNMLGFTIQSSLPAGTGAEIKGLIRYRQTGKWLRYSCQTRLQPGLNRIDAGSVRLSYTRSDAALQELFVNYKMLPQGTYQYCVEIVPLSAAGERVAGGGDEQCVINKSEDLFLINLVDPENNAKIHERNPVLSWIVNYPFASQLTYRIRVAEVKQGQTNVTAITRNNPVYAESNLPQTTTTYPVYAKQLELFQPYAWTVDAYFKGLLLGGAEPWRFTIVEDSEMVAVPVDIAYYQIDGQNSKSSLIAVGELKLKSTIHINSDTLQVLVSDVNGRKVKQLVESFPLVFGENLIRLECRFALRHKQHYQVQLVGQAGNKVILPFVYYNPDFVEVK